MGNPVSVKKRPKKGAAKVRHLGRNKLQIERYYARTYYPRKIRHILRNNGTRGMEMARKYAKEHDCIIMFNRVVRELGLE